MRGGEKGRGERLVLGEVNKILPIARQWEKKKEGKERGRGKEKERKYFDGALSFLVWLSVLLSPLLLPHSPSPPFPPPLPSNMGKEEEEESKERPPKEIFLSSYSPPLQKPPSPSPPPSPNTSQPSSNPSHPSLPSPQTQTSPFPPSP